MRSLLTTLILAVTCSAHTQTAYWAATYKEHFKRGSTVLVAKEGYTFERTSYDLYIEKFYDNGEHPLRELITYADRRKKILEGPWKKFYANGQLEITGRYTEGVEDGRWYFYRENGDLWKTCTYQDGEEKCELEETVSLPETKPVIPPLSSGNTSKEEVPIYGVVEEMPRFPGCEELPSLGERQKCAQQELLKNIYSRLKIPKDYDGPAGTIVITFVVEMDGAVTNARIVRSIDERVDAVALEIVKTMPNFIPGLQRGEPVRTQFNLPIKIVLI